MAGIQESERKKSCANSHPKEFELKYGTRTAATR